MLVDELERADVAILDAALSAERLEPRAEPGVIATTSTESGQSRFGAVRGAVSGVLLGVALWAAILAPMVRH
jgi:hypothetical protein